MAELQSTNVQGTLCVNGVALGGGKDFKYCCFTSSTTFTPSQDLIDGDGAINVLAVGGGGAEGSYALKWCCACNDCFGNISKDLEPGGGGASKNTWIEIDSTDACTVTVGAGAAANGVSHDGSTFDITSNSTNGGASTFGEVSVAGGGNGLLCGLCCAQGKPSTRCTVNCPSTRNGGNSFAGGAQNFTYGGQYCYAISNGYFVCCGGGKFAGNQTAKVWDCVDQTTGSVDFTMFTGDENMGNVGTGNPNYFGVGGNAPIIGGLPACRDKIVDQTTAGSCYATSSNNVPNRFFGAGGNGDGFTACNNSIASPTTVEVKGMDGNDGIVVLTWYE